MVVVVVLLLLMMMMMRKGRSGGTDTGVAPYLIRGSNAVGLMRFGLTQALLLLGVACLTTAMRAFLCVFLHRTGCTPTSTTTTTRSVPPPRSQAAAAAFAHDPCHSVDDDGDDDADGPS
jgi:hypothetical protein